MVILSISENSDMKPFGLKVAVIIHFRKLFSSVILYMNPEETAI